MNLVQFAALREEWNDLDNKCDLSGSNALAAVTEDGYALQYVKDVSENKEWSQAADVLLEKTRDRAVQEMQKQPQKRGWFR